MGLWNGIKSAAGGIVDGVKWMKPGGQEHLRHDTNWLARDKEIERLKKEGKLEEAEAKAEEVYEPGRSSSLENVGLWIIDIGILVVGILDGLDGLAPPSQGDEFTDGRHKWNHIDALLDDVVAEDIGWSGDAATNYNNQIALLQSQLDELHDLDGQMQTLISDHADTVRQMHDAIDGLMVGLIAARIAATAARFAGPEGRAISIAIQIAAVAAAVPTAVGMATNTGMKASQTAASIDTCTNSYTEVANTLAKLASTVDNWTTPAPVSSQVGVMNSVEKKLNSGDFADANYPSDKSAIDDSTDSETSPGAHINVEIGHNRDVGAVISGVADWNANGAAGGLPATPPAMRSRAGRNDVNNRAPLGSALTTNRRGNDDSGDSDDAEAEPRFARPRLVELVAVSAEATHLSEYFSDFADSMSQMEDQFLGSVDKLVSAAQQNQLSPPPPVPAPDVASTGAGAGADGGQRAPIGGVATAAAEQDLGVPHAL